MSIQETVWKFLKGKGLPEKSIAAVMGNIQAESNFDVKMIEKGNGIGFGLCQWSYGRRKQLEKYGTSLDHQLNFLWAELSGENPGAVGATFQWINKSAYLSHANFMKGNGSIGDLTAAFCHCWERPKADEATSHLESRRKPKAHEYFNQFTGSTGAYIPNAAGATDSTGASTAQTIEVESTNYQVVKGSEKFGDYLFGRRFRITISDSAGTAIDVSQMHCTFSIIKTIQMEPNTSEISIYNLNAQTENNIRLNGKRVTVEAGYEGTQFGLIFDGDIIQCIQEKEEAHTYKLTVIALDSDRAINFEIANFSILRGQNHRNIVDDIVNKAKNPIPLGSISEKLKNSKLIRGKVFLGKASDYINQIAKSNGLQFYMDDGKLNLIDLKELPKDEIVKLDSTSGLIGVPEQTDYGVSGQCLLNPQIKLNSLIHIDNSLIRDKRIEFGTSSTAPATGVASTAGMGVRDKITAEAKRICDDPNVRYSMDYRTQTRGGLTYWDCSSLVKHCYKTAGLEIVDIANNQYNQTKQSGKMITKSEALPGDLVFWRENGRCYHIAIYAGEDYIYAAATDESPPADQVLKQKIYGNYEMGRPKVLIDSDAGTPPSAPSSESSPTPSTAPSNDTQSTGGNALQETQSMVRALDKDGIYRVIKLEYRGDTRGNDWYVNFETITQLGGMIPMISS